MRGSDGRNGGVCFPLITLGVCVSVEYPAIALGGMYPADRTGSVCFSDGRIGWGPVVVRGFTLAVCGSVFSHHGRC